MTIGNSFSRPGWLILLMAACALLVIGPDWPTRTSDLICKQGAERRVEATFTDMNACSAHLAAQCYCSVQESRLTSAYYLGFVPSLFLLAIWLASRSTALGVAAVIAVLYGSALLARLPWALASTGLRPPNLLLGVTLLWAQLVFFGPNLYSGPGSSLVIPEHLAYVFTLAFWAIVAVVFGVVARHMRSSPARLVGSILCVVTVVVLVRLVTPLMNWEILIESP
jgi:predicted membrane protein